MEASARGNSAASMAALASVNADDFLVWKQGFGSTVDVAADGEGSAQVDSADFLLWQRGFGTGPGAVKSDGDANLDGFVDDLDLTKWQEDFGTTTTTAVAASTAASSSTIVVASAPAMTAALYDATGVWFDAIPLTPGRVVATLRQHGIGGE